MNTLQILLQNRQNELMRKFGDSIKVCQFLWKEYTESFDLDKIYSNKEKFKNRCDFINKRDFNEDDFGKMVEIFKVWFKDSAKKDIDWDKMPIDIILQTELVKKLPSDGANPFGDIMRHMRGF